MKAKIAITASYAIGILRLQAQSKEIAKDLRLINLRKKAAVYSFTMESKEKAKQFSSSVMNALKSHLGFLYSALDYYAELSLDQYEQLCGILGLFPGFKEDILIIYYDNKGVQLSYNETKPDIIRELSKLGWKPLEERLEGFLKLHSSNEDALLLWYVMNLRKFESGSIDIPAFAKVIEMLNSSGYLSWLYSAVGIITTLNPLGADRSSLLKNDVRFQKESHKFIESVEAEIIRNPFKSGLYYQWREFAMMAQNLDTKQLLSKLRFPPSNRMVESDFSILHFPFFLTTNWPRG
ncbi:MAG: hypothetical protein LBH03_07465 [Holophagales bacterium]|jgi:hypothetical protein|nr:hypothetical protein [Holophagales bacterium]